MRYSYKIALVLSLLMTGTAIADDKLKGPYAIAGSQMCLTAPSGFTNDSKGNPTIATGKDNFVSANNFESRYSFNGDGTGSVSGTFVSIPPPDNRADFKAAVSGGTFSYSFTHSAVANNSFETNVTPGTYKATIDYGPRAGQQFTIDSGRRVFQISNDQTRGTMATRTLDVERITYSDPSQTSLARICFVSGSLIRLD